MKRPTHNARWVHGIPVPVHDYKPALQTAVSWLGDRYLLAEPVQRRGEPTQPYFSEPRRWYPPSSQKVTRAVNAKRRSKVNHAFWYSFQSV